jgi:hypothetical protein
MTSAINRYGFFAQSRDGNLANLDEFTQKYHQKLLKQSDIVTKSKLLRSFHRAKPLNTKNYLQAFIEDFSDNPAFADTVALYQQQLSQYQQAALQKTVDSLSLADHQEDTYKLTAQQQQWHQLMETLQRCVNHRFAKALAWHPHHLENYYLAKLLVQWQTYFNRYKAFNKEPLAKITAQAIAQERKEMIVQKHVEDQHQLDQEKMSYSPIRLTRQQEKLQKNKQQDLDTLKTDLPTFEEHTHSVLQWTNENNHSTITRVYNAAIEEIHRQTHQVNHHPTLFKKASSSQETYSLAILKQIDTLSEMQVYREIFTAESEKMATVSTAAPSAKV